MNIFVTDKDPVKAALYLDDKRLNKMILESAQMISTAVQSFGVVNPILYKATHANHPCNVWLRQSKQNYLWLHQHVCAMVVEKMIRFNQEEPHKSFAVIMECEQYQELFSNVEMTPFANCSAYKELDIVEAYRQTMRDKWNSDSNPTWRNVGAPYWR